MKHLLLSTLILTTLLLFPNMASIQTDEHPFSSAETIDHIEDLITPINNDMVYTYLSGLVDFGVRYTGTENCSQAADWLEQQFNNLGLTTYQQQWEAGGYNSTNVIAELPGTDPTSNVIYIVSGHYDTVPSAPGACDDASGVTGVLACADALKDETFNHTIRFVAFSGEEVGTYGSYSYAKYCYREGENIRAVFNLDMIGYANTTDGGNTLRYHSQEHSQWMATYTQNIIENYPDLIGLTVQTMPNYIGHDGQPFVDYGYNSAWIAENDGYPWCHSENDTIEHINFTYLTKCSRAIAATLATIASEPTPFQVRLTGPSEGMLLFKDHQLLTLDLPTLWYMELRGTTVLLGRCTATAEVYGADELAYLTFCIDGNSMGWDSTPPYEWKIQGKHSFYFGRHTLSVVAATPEGDIATDEMIIYNFSLSSAYGPW